MNISNLSLGLTLINGGDEIDSNFTVNDGVVQIWFPAQAWQNNRILLEPAIEWLINLGWYQEHWVEIDDDGFSNTKDLIAQYDPYFAWCYK